MAVSESFLQGLSAGSSRLMARSTASSRKTSSAKPRVKSQKPPREPTAAELRRLTAARGKRMAERWRRAIRAEIANGITHGIGAGMSIVGLVLLVVFASKDATVWHIVSFAIYGATMVLLYLASTLYHSLPNPRAKRVFRILDHSAIYLAIAGTYTPFTLVNMRGPWGWTLFGIVWGLAFLGVAFKAFFVGRYDFISTIVYILMGWMIVIAWSPAREAISSGGLMWLLLGGISYTAGTIFYAWGRLPFNHAIWHLFVLGGSVCHYLAVLFHVLPARVN